MRGALVAVGSGDPCGADDGSGDGGVLLHAAVRVGAIMAGGWGLLLGILRNKSNGMAAPYVAHLAADTTIAVLAITVLH